MCFLECNSNHKQTFILFSENLLCVDSVVNGGRPFLECNCNQLHLWIKGNRFLQVLDRQSTFQAYGSLPPFPHACFVQANIKLSADALLKINAPIWSPDDLGILLRMLELLLGHVLGTGVPSPQSLRFFFFGRYSELYPRCECRNRLKKSWPTYPNGVGHKLLWCNTYCLNWRPVAGTVQHFRWGGGGGVSHRKSLWRVWERASQEKFENVDRVVHLRHFRLLKGGCDALDPPLSSDLERERLRWPSTESWKDPVFHGMAFSLRNLGCVTGAWLLARVVLEIARSRCVLLALSLFLFLHRARALNY